MEKTNLKPLGEKEMAQLVGGKWVEINGKFYWLATVKGETGDKEAMLLSE